MEDIFSALIGADIGVETTEKLIEEVKVRLTAQNLTNPSDIKAKLQEIITEIVDKPAPTITRDGVKPWIIMVVGVNGVGKTTTIGKIAQKLKNEGKQVLLAAGDTYRAAAIEQLCVWADRIGVDIIKNKPGSDPSSVAFDAIKAAKARNKDVVIVDTAGRLHTKTNLMEELQKVKRIIARESEGGPHETLLVLDATTGQNAIQQARAFNDMIDISSIVLTKLDGTAKGGVCIGISDQFNVPIQYIGIGEKVEDLRPFNGKDFAAVLF